MRGCYNRRVNQCSFKDIALKDKDEAFVLLSSQQAGLSGRVAEEHLSLFGKNELTGREVVWQEILLRQFRSAFIYLLFAASAIALYLGEYLDAAIIFLFLFINAGLGFFQEYRAEHALKLLKQFVERTTRVRRDGKEIMVLVSDIVPGDVALLDAGDMIPADGYFLRADSVTVDESPMTGESAPVAKEEGKLAQTPLGFYDARNIGFSRTTLLSGDAELLIFATGDHTEVGAIAGKMYEAESPSAFERGVSHFSKFILKLILVTVPIVYLLHAVIQGGEVGMGAFLLFLIALTVSAIPEALPLVTTIALSRGALLLAKKQVVPRRLSAIEDLGSIDVLCTDKTGTITENRLSVRSIWGDEQVVLRHALMAPRSLIGASRTQNGVFDHALLAYASEEMKTSLSEIVRIDELPFDPLRRKESVLIEEEGKRLLVMRGAPEVVFAASGKKIPKEAEAWAREEGNKGCRVLAIGVKSMPKKGYECLCGGDEKRMHILGMIAFADPLKPSSKQAIGDAGRLGVRVKIITGDSREVAGWVGYEAGVISRREAVLSGEEFDLLSEDEKMLAVEKYDVFARTTPLQKYAIIQLLEREHLVGFLGEGFNDAPALKMAHVGLAVSGASDIAQDASDIILLNPSLEVIVDGIREGRKIFANSVKYIRATLASNFGNFYALAFASLFVPFLPMLPIQILLLNLLSDFPMISIATDAVDDAELKRPRGYQIGELTAIAIVLGIVSTLFDFAFFGYFMQYEKEVLQTMWFVGSVLTELVLLFSIRTALPFWRAKQPSATVLFLSIFVAIITLALPFIPVTQRIFGFITPTTEHLTALVLLVFFYFVSSEVMKLLFYRFWSGRRAFRPALS